MKEDIVSGLIMLRGKMSSFVSLSLFGLTLVIKLHNLDFEVH